MQVNPLVRNGLLIAYRGGNCTHSPFPSTYRAAAAFYGKYGTMGFRVVLRKRKGDK